MLAAMKRLDWLAAVLLAPFAVLALGRLLAHDELLPFVWANSVTAWIYLPAWAVLALALARRRAVLALAALSVVLCHAVWVAPGLIASHEPARGPRLRVVTANLLAVNDRPAELARELMAIDADVIVLEEVSPRWLPELEALFERHPHHDVFVRDDAFGIAIFSRRPLVRAEMIDLEGVPMIDAIVDPGRPVRILGVHTLPPVDRRYAVVWRRQLALLAERAERSELPTIVLGDLNATSHSAALRRLERSGFRDAHDALGRGLATTWPNGLFPLPSLRLDHVLVGPGVVALAVREGRGAGSDHRPVIADVAVRGAGDQRRQSMTIQPAHARETAAHASGSHGVSAIDGASHAQIAGDAS